MEDRIRHPRRSCSLQFLLFLSNHVLLYHASKTTTAFHQPLHVSRSLYYQDPLVRRSRCTGNPVRTSDWARQAAEINEVADDEERQKFLRRHKYWVVLVDDEESIRTAVGDYLYDQGYQITACADADALLEVCNNPKEQGQLAPVPDAIISDIRMPGKDGIELLGMIRADDRLKRVPVILLTAKALTQDRIAGFKAGADAYLPKPFNPDELLSILDNAIQRQQQMKGRNGVIADMKQELADIKHLMKQNSAKLVKKTDVYLTPVEREVLTLLSQGYSNPEIAEERGVSLAGVTRTIQKLYKTTGTKTRTELVRWAIETGYIPRRR